MEQSVKMTPKDFFLHLGVVATLYVSTIAFISFVFAVINLALPDLAAGMWAVDSARSSIAWSLSVFIIVYPVFVYLLFKVSHYLRERTERAAVSIRKWFIYLTIFLTAVTLIVDGIVLLTTFLQGEQLTLRFLLKVLAIVIVALAIFWFSVKELKDTFITKVQTLKTTVFVTTICVALCVVIGFVYMGSPRQARLVLEDTQRVTDLTFIQNQIVEYWRTTQTLPSSLADINDPVQYIMVPTDPATAGSYEYTAINPTTFELCATFATDQQEVYTGKTPVSYDVFEGSDAYFTHGVGRTCFTRTINPERVKKAL